MEKILIVDDEKEIRDLVEIYLKGEGCKSRRWRRSIICIEK